MVGSIIISIFEMRKLKLREIKSPGQDKQGLVIFFHHHNAVLNAFFALTKWKQKKFKFNILI